MNMINVNFTPITNDYATVSVNRINLMIEDGYVAYRRSDYEGLIDEEGNPREPLPDEISYFRAFYNISVNADFSNYVIVPESEVPENQIFGTVTPPIVTK